MTTSKLDPGVLFPSRRACPVVWLAALFFHLVLTTAQAGPNVVTWGDNSSGQTNVPPDLTNAVAVAAGGAHSLALRADGTVVAWGGNYYGQTNVPVGLTNVVVAATGYNHSLALRTDGTVVAWGENGSGQTNVPAGLTNAVALAGGDYHSLALRADGTVIAWGGNNHGQTNMPTGLRNVVAVAGDGWHSLALRTDGTVVAWGSNDYGETDVPADLTNVVTVAAGVFHSLALRADGTVVAWGWNAFGQTNVPTGLTNVVAIAGGWRHSLALRADGIVVAWGSNGYGQTDVPTDLTNAVAVASGDSHNLALIRAGAPFLTSPLVNRSVVSGETAFLRMTASGAGPLSYQWKFNGTNLPGATNAVLMLSALQFDQEGAYSVAVSNSFGQVTSSEMLLSVVPLLIDRQPQNQTAFLDGTASFTVTAIGEGPLSYQWQFNGAPLSGATNSTLTLSNLRFDQAGTYSVVVSNVLGVIRSLEADLSVIMVAAWGDNQRFWPRCCCRR